MTSDPRSAGSGTSPSGAGAIPTHKAAFALMIVTDLLLTFVCVFVIASQMAEIRELKRITVILERRTTLFREMARHRVLTAQQVDAILEGRVP